MDLQMEEKKQEIESVQTVLKSELKLEKQEISKLHIELKNRKSEVNCYQILLPPWGASIKILQ
jgi:hypothetical protein